MAEGAEIVRQGYERLNADDLEGFLELCDPEIELDDVPDRGGLVAPAYSPCTSAAMSAAACLASENSIEVLSR
jgi:hypothetical protein